MPAGCHWPLLSPWPGDGHFPVGAEFDAGRMPANATARNEEQAAGILSNRFWILTHPDWVEKMEERVALMRDGRLDHGAIA